MHIDSIVTDLVATSDGATAASAGGTVGVRHDLPRPAGDARPERHRGRRAVRTGERRTADADRRRASTPARSASRRAACRRSTRRMQSVLGTTRRVDQPAARGVRHHHPHARAVRDPSTARRPSAPRTASSSSINYEGGGDGPLAQLLAAIPSDQLPGEGIPGFPLNTSPQAMVNLLKETHVTGIALAYGNVNVNASPAFEFTPAGPDADPSAATSASGGFTPSGSLGRGTARASRPRRRRCRLPAPGGAGRRLERRARWRRRQRRCRRGRCWRC